MKVDELLEATGISGAELARRLNYNAETVYGRRRDGLDIPAHWWPRLREAGMDVSAWEVTESVGGGGARRAAPRPRAEEAQDGAFREWDSTPTPPSDALYVQPVRIDYSKVQGYIEGAYKLAAEYAIKDSDPILADCIYTHAEQAGEAWAKWIESEPRVAALIQRLMIGTPLGEVIGVHVTIVFAYVLARSAAARIAAAAAAETSGQSEASVDGAAYPAAESHLG